MEKSTILVERRTRKLLRQIGTKGQTYDEVIKELIRTKRNQASIDGGFENLKAN
jgi:hypothetical protein